VSDDQFFVESGSSLSISSDQLLSLANDFDGDELSLIFESDPINGGSFVDSDNGNFVFTPDPSFVGTDQITFRVSDGLLSSGTATLTFDVIDHPFGVRPAFFEVVHDRDLVVEAEGGLLLGSFHVGGLPLEVVSVSSSPDGDIEFESDGSFVFTPTAGFVGVAEFIFEVSDGINGNLNVALEIDVFNTETVLTPDSFNVVLGTPFRLPSQVLLVNDVIDPGETASVELVGFRPFGLSIDDAGVITYSPPAFLSDGDTVTFNYVVDDGISLSDPAEVTLNIVSTAPEANGDTFFVQQGTELVGSLFANDGLALNGATNIVLQNQPLGLELLLDSDGNPNGTFRYNPPSRFVGSVSFSYFLTNEFTANSETAQVTIFVDNTAPVGSPDTFVFHHSEEVVVDADNGVLANDFDEDFDDISAVLLQDGQFGEVDLRPDGSFDYTPGETFVESDSFVYQVDDGAEFSRSVLVTLRFTNEETIVGPSRFFLQQGEPAPFSAEEGLLATAFSPDGDPLTIVDVSDPQNGQLDYDVDGSFTYTPADGFAEEDFFFYSVSDGVSVSGPVIATLVVGNSAPLANGDFFQVAHGTELVRDVAGGILANDFDSDGDDLVISHTEPNNGQLNLNEEDGSFTYTPDPEFVGRDFFFYTISDGVAESRQVRVDLDVVNSVPVGQADSFRVRAGENLVVPVESGLLSNDFDPDGDSLQITLESGPANGEFVDFNNDGSFEYRPNDGFVGQDRFSYRVTDGAEDSELIFVQINVDNQAPIAVDRQFSITQSDSLTVPVEDGLVSTGFDFDGDELTAHLLDDGFFGSVLIDENGSFVYTRNDPNVEFKEDSFTYYLSDGIEMSQAATVRISFVDVPPPTQGNLPFAEGDSFTTEVNETLEVDATNGVLANDTDSDGEALTVTVVEDQGPLNGTLNLFEDGSFTYLPNEDFVGVDSFTYLVVDESGGEDTGVVSISVTSDALVAGDRVFSVHHGQSLSVDASEGLLAGLDLLGDPTIEIEVSEFEFGTAVLSDNGDGSFVFVPEGDFVGTASFEYTLDVGGLTESGTVFIEFFNLAPRATPNIFTVHHSESLVVFDSTFGLLANDVDDFDDEISIARFDSLPTLTTNFAFDLDDGSFSYTPQGILGTDRFSYVATDGFDESAPTYVTINVFDVRPVAVDDSLRVLHDQPLTINAADLLANDYDDDGDQFFITRILAGPNNGNLNPLADGSFEYVGGQGFVGLDRFTYEISDGILTSQATVFVEVFNSAPVLAPNFYSTQHSTPLSVNAENGVLADDFDPNQDELTATLVPNSANNGTVNLEPDGSFTFDPEDGFIGLASFEYEVFDGAETSRERVEIEVLNNDPTAHNQFFQIDRGEENGSGEVSGNLILENADIDRDELRVEIVNDASNGDFELDEDEETGRFTGGFTYTPNDDFVGTERVDFRILDSADGTSQTRTVTIRVVNHAPRAFDSNSVFHHSGDFVVDLSESVFDADQGHEENFEFEISTSSGLGSFTRVSGSRFRFVPSVPLSLFFEENQTTVTFDYTVTDGFEVTQGIGSVEIVNEAPIGTPDFFTVDHDRPLRENLLANDHDVDFQDSLSIVGPVRFVRSSFEGSSSEGSSSEGRTVARLDRADEAAGTFTLLNQDGDFEYIPEENFVGTETFSYTVTDGVSFTEVEVTIGIQNNAPIAVQDIFHSDGESPITLNLLGNDEDLEGDDLEVVLDPNSSPQFGDLEIDAAGNVIYTPDGSSNVAFDIFQYSAREAGGAPNALLSQPVSVLIIFAEEAFEPVDDFERALVGEEVSGNVLDNDFNAQGAELQVIPFTENVTGSYEFSLSEDGSYSFVPEEGYEFTGTLSFSYELLLDEEDVSPTEGALHIIINDLTAEDREFDVLPGRTLTGSVDVGDHRAELVGDGPYNGDLTFNSDGSFLFIPEDGFTGDVTFTYRLVTGFELPGIGPASEDGTPPEPIPEAGETGTVTITVTNALLEAEDVNFSISFRRQLEAGTYHVFVWNARSSRGWAVCLHS